MVKGVGCKQIILLSFLNFSVLKICLNYSFQHCKTKYKKDCKPDYKYGRVCDKVPYQVSKFTDVKSRKSMCHINYTISTHAM